MQWNTESDEGVEGALDDEGEKECLCQREATRSLSPNAKIARRVSFSFHCEISKNSIIINSGQGGGGRCRGSRERQMNGAGLGSARATMTTDTSTSTRLVREGTGVAVVVVCVCLAPESRLQ